MSVKALTWAFGQHGISDGAKILLLVLADYADEDGVCWPSRRTLADHVGKSADTVDRRLESLCEAGLVAVENRNRASAGGGVIPMANVYRLQLERAGVRGRRSRKNAATPTDGDGRETAARGGGINADGRKSADIRESAERVAAPDAARVAAFSLAHIDKPPIEPPDSSAFDAVRASDAELLAEATRLAGASLNVTTGATHHAADLRALISPAKGVPCDWALDVAPAIVAKAAACARKGELIGSWTWIREGAVRLRDRRLRGLPDPQTLSATEAPHVPTTATATRERAARDNDAGMLGAAHARRAARLARDAVAEGSGDAARLIAGPSGVREAG